MNELKPYMILTEYNVVLYPAKENLLFDGTILVRLDSILMVEEHVLYACMHASYMYPHNTNIILETFLFLDRQTTGRDRE